MRIKWLVLALLYLAFAVKPALATAPSIGNIPSVITPDSAFSITVSMSGLSSNSIYKLRVALAPLGTSNYFGSTFNGSNWYDGTPSPISYSNFLSITTDSSGSWAGNIEGKIETSDPNFPNITGVYDLKVGRYTETGTSATWSDITQVTITTPTPSFSPTQTPSTSSTPTSFFTISNTPSQINSDQSFNATINLKLPNNPNSTFYLKGAFKKADSTNYFGLTKVSDTWVKNGLSYNQQLPVNTDSNGNWSGSLEIKPDSEDSGLSGSADYLFKVAKYSNSGSLSWSNEATIHIEQVSSATSTPEPSPESTPTPNPSIDTEESFEESAAENEIEYQIASIAAVSTSSPSASAKINIKSSKQNSALRIFGIVLIFAGIAIPLVYLLIKHKLKFKIP